MKKRIVVLLLCTFFLTACGSPKVVKPLPSSTQSSNQTSNVPPVTTSKSGGYYLDDGPGDNPPKDIDSIPNAIPKNEPYLARTTKPYKALGATYTPMTTWQPYKERGVASWYGKRYHGRKTASGEVYDMYSMSAAHTTLPLPSYVKVTNPANGRFVIVRVNDRGPFKSNRIIDLSYAAAYQLRFASIGSTLVEIEAIDPNNTASYAQAAPAKVADLPKMQAIPTTPANNNFTIAPQYFVQVGAFKNEVNAQALAKRVQSLDIAPNAGINTVYNDNLHRLKLGPYENKSEAEKIVSELRKLLNLRAIITNQ
ncbi:MAG: septal ring lytic transglycosylase RlpA family lipoprotein [Methylotenera sp.]|nr:MAG: septal ring lytic transglycosylase RlpA family lipoprotein [Methylotenera sp.]